MCEVVYKDSIENKKHPLIKICPAWQVEDGLRHWNELRGIDEESGSDVIENEMLQVLKLFHYYPETAYQKIEEYLWSVLK